MNIVIGYTHKHAEYFARHIKRWNPSEYRTVMCPDILCSFNSSYPKTVYVLGAPRFIPTNKEMETRIEMRRVLAHFRNVIIIEADLP